MTTRQILNPKLSIRYAGLLEEKDATAKSVMAAKNGEISRLKGVLDDSKKELEKAKKQQVLNPKP